MKTETFTSYSISKNKKDLFLNYRIKKRMIVKSALYKYEIKESTTTTKIRIYKVFKQQSA